MRRDKTGRKMRMRKPYTEGLATHGDPESCVAPRKGRGEALTGACAGSATEPRNKEIRVPTPWGEAEGHMERCAIASGALTRRGRRTDARTESFCARTGRSRPPFGQMAAGGGS